MLSRIFATAAGLGACVTAFGLSSSSDAAPKIQSAFAMEKAIASLPGKGIPAFYSGNHSQNMSHLANFSTSVLQDVPDNKIQPDAYYKELEHLEPFCPALSRAPQKTNLADWILKNVKPQASPNISRDFLEQSYFTVASMALSPKKIEALTYLNTVIPDSPGFISFMNRKRAELQKHLAARQDLQISNARWLNTTKEGKEKIMAGIVEEIFATLMPGREVEMPKVFYIPIKIMRSDPSFHDSGEYNANFNEIYVNGQVSEVASNFSVVKEVIVHESFHAFQFMIAEWYLKDEIKNPELKREARFYYTTMKNDGSFIDAKDNYNGYRTGFVERGAWSFERAAGAEIIKNSIAEDMFINRDVVPAVKIANPPRYDHNGGKGSLPSSCFAPAA